MEQAVVLVVGGPDRRLVYIRDIVGDTMSCVTPDGIELDIPVSSFLDFTGFSRK
jgi:hypothetical protein